jgi:hypothetical protein
LQRPENFHNSLTRTIYDQQYFTITDLDYEGSMLHIMETTKLLGVAELTHEPKHWSVWSAARWIFEERIKEIIYIENNN